MVSGEDRWLAKAPGDGSGRAVAQSGRGPHTIGVMLPGSDHDLRLFEAVKDLLLQALVPEFPIKTLAEFVLPRATRRNVQGLRPELGQPVAQSLGNHLWAVVLAWRRSRTVRAHP